MVSKEVLSSAIRGTVASGRAGDVLLVFLGRGTSMRELNGTYVEVMTRLSVKKLKIARRVEPHHYPISG